MCLDHVSHILLVFAPTTFYEIWVTLYHPISLVLICLHPWWLSGRMLACHTDGPGSFLGRCRHMNVGVGGCLKWTALNMILVRTLPLPPPKGVDNSKWTTFTVLDLMMIYGCLPMRETKCNVHI